MGGSGPRCSLDRPIHDVSISFPPSYPEETKAIFDRTADIGIEHGPSGSCVVKNMKLRPSGVEAHVDYRRPSSVSLSAHQKKT